ncbi:carbohydrate-binding family 9-like protein [Chitinophagaceae bacterium LB-8]|uniref:Carbohydrate-binding family 9-like protein n=1 Tax=Paraflavisolibacter caeni TaxID=2982496 RepID=A0A9X2XX18_9BACT|nr:carbohydrate-binding family 9-like protein [Paraflavisolibacter caeni]MCU7549258.1 carbohydrate-binding family 9-like protein [Paraflavisolibacter caeni]
MKELTVSNLKRKYPLPDKEFLQLDSLERHKIDQVSWSSYPYQPEVAFAIAHKEERIFLKYFVKEKSIRAVTKNINGSVWEDSCVEFFISFDDKGYYNLEFNCEGVALVGFGKEKSKRELVSVDLIKKINTQSVIRKERDGLIYWELSISIPLDVFVHHTLTTINGKQCRANFYKCGDLLPEPHFISWSRISSAEPNFHLPQFFGTLRFE